MKIDKLLSNFVLAKKGVPQGSRIGPLLFNIYINDFCKMKISGKIITFADDTIILYSASTYEALENIINRDLKIIYDWFTSNELQVNVEKTCYIIFNLKATSEIHLDLKFCDCKQESCNDHLIKYTPSLKYLGILFNQNWKFKDHINLICSKLRFILFKFYHLKKYIKFELLLKLYFAWVQSRIQYGILVWGGDYITNIKPLLNLHEKFIRYFPNTILLNVRQLFVLNSLIFLKKFPTVAKINLNNNYNFRRKNFYLVPTPYKDIFKKHFDYLSVILFNKLPYETQIEPNFRRFKKLCTLFILNQNSIENLLNFVR